MQLFALFLFFKQKGRGWGGEPTRARIYTRKAHLITPYSPPLFLPKIIVDCFVFFANRVWAGNNAFYLVYEERACRGNKRHVLSYEG